MFKIKTDDSNKLDRTEPASRALEGLIFECKDKTAQFMLSQVVKFGLCFFRDEDADVVKDFLNVFKHDFLA